jgi:hypothetical protein
MASKACSYCISPLAVTVHQLHGCPKGAGRWDKPMKDELEMLTDTTWQERKQLESGQGSLFPLSTKHLGWQVQLAVSPQQRCPIGRPVLDLVHPKVFYVLVHVHILKSIRECARYAAHSVVFTY